MSKSNSSNKFRLKGQLKVAYRSSLSDSGTPEAAEFRNRGYEKIMALLDRFKGH